MAMTGIQAFLEVLARANVKHIFGNPGTTELPLMDELAIDSRFQFILGLQEVPVMAMADGYAMASRSVGVVNVHICCGLGNAMGMLYNAWCEGTPLVLTAGQQDRRLLLEEPVLAGDMLSVARPWTKWAVEVQRVEDMPTALRRAIQTAMTPPTGPVFMALPLDLQMETAPQFDLAPPRIPSGRVRPPAEDLAAAAKALVDAKNPAILAGSRVTESGAIAALTALAEQLGAPVFAEAGTAHGRVPFPTDHALYAGSLGLWSPDVRQQLANFDWLLIVGMPVLCQYIYHEPSRPIPEQVRIIQLDSHARELSKNYPADIGLIGDPQAGLQELSNAVQDLMSSTRRAASEERKQSFETLRSKAQRDLRSKIESEWSTQPMTSLALMGAIARVLPASAAVVEEAITTTNNVLERLGAIKDSYGYFAQRGWALGWGLGCSLGVKLAWPDRPVLCLLGEGSAMYGIQGLWTAARYQIPVTFVICNNAQYKILKKCGDQLPLPQMSKQNYLGMDLTNPEIDFVGLARSFGVEARRVHSPDELSEWVEKSMAGDKPTLLDVPLSQ